MVTLIKKFEFFQGLNILKTIFNKFSETLAFKNASQKTSNQRYNFGPNPPKKTADTFSRG